MARRSGVGASWARERRRARRGRGIANGRRRLRGGPRKRATGQARRAAVAVRERRAVGRPRARVRARVDVGRRAQVAAGRGRPRAGVGRGGERARGVAERAPRTISAVGHGGPRACAGECRAHRHAVGRRQRTRECARSATRDPRGAAELAGNTRGVAAACCTRPSEKLRGVPRGRREPGSDRARCTSARGTRTRSAWGKRHTRWAGTSPARPHNRRTSPKPEPLAPSDVTVIVGGDAPGDPRVRVAATGHPGPTDIRNPNPTTVVEHHAAEGVVALPDPIAVFRQSPTASADVRRKVSPNRVPIGDPHRAVFSSFTQLPYGSKVGRNSVIARGSVSGTLSGCAGVCGPGAGGAPDGACGRGAALGSAAAGGCVCVAPGATAGSAAGSSNQPLPSCAWAGPSASRQRQTEQRNQPCDSDHASSSLLEQAACLLQMRAPSLRALAAQVRRIGSTQHSNEFAEPCLALSRDFRAAVGCAHASLRRGPPAHHRLRSGPGQ